jgi:hypothetical protein
MKPEVYQEIPDYDQETQYVIQLPPVELENGDIYYGVEIKELEIDDTESMI